MKSTKILPIIIYIFSFLHPTKAQFPSDILYQSIASATPGLPNYLQSIEDTSVPDAITIKRITEYNADWDWYPTHDYAKIQPWNADASLYKIRAVALYDAITHQKYRDLPGGQIYPVYWSNINSNLMYSFREDGAIKTYTVSDESVQTIFNLAGYDIVKLGPGEGNIDKNDHYVALIGKSGLDMDVIIFDLQTHQIIHTETFAGAWGNNASVPEYVDWVSVSQSGNFVGIMWNHNTTSQGNPFNGHYGVEIYNTTNMQYLRRIVKYGNHGDFGYASDGDEVFVQFWGPTGTVNMYYLNRMERVVLSTHADFNSAGHISCRNLNRPGWAYISQDYQDQSGQIIAMKLDDSGLVEHFGHHYSSSSNYAKSPMPVPTPNGDKIMFKSDFGTSTNSGSPVVYVFTANVTPPPVNISGLLTNLSEQDSASVIVMAEPVGGEGTNTISVYPNALGAYIVSNVSFQTDYKVSAYMDSNTNGTVDYWEAQGEYLPNPVSISYDNAVNIDFSIIDPVNKDGVPYWWLLTYLGIGNTNTEYNAVEVDTDNDGMTDYQEWKSGTNPQDANDVFKVSINGPSEAGPAPGKVSIEWKSLVNRKYTILRADDLVAGFVPIQTGISPTPPLNVFVDDNAAGDGSYFYRVKVE